jgi:hypothetical protein
MLHEGLDNIQLDPPFSTQDLIYPDEVTSSCYQRGRFLFSSIELCLLSSILDERQLWCRLGENVNTGPVRKENSPHIAFQMV